MRQARARTSQADDEMDLEALGAWLEKQKRVIDGASMLDGYLAAIVVGPSSIPPDEWFFDLLGPKGNIATAHGKTHKAIMAIVARHNAISESLSTAPQTYAPIFQRTGNGVVFAGPWCLGFAHAMKLRWSAWAPLREARGIECGLMLPIMLYCADQIGAPMDPAPNGINTKEYLKTAYHDIPLVIPAIREFWMPQRVAQASR
jgi:uncharacterized protein